MAVIWSGREEFLNEKSRYWEGKIRIRNDIVVYRSDSKYVK